MPYDSKEQRRIFGRFATGVTVVTTGRDGDFAGLTANAICSVSLDPPLVLVSVDKKAGSHAEIARHGCYAINILAADQEEISQRFAKPGPKDFSDLNCTTGVTGAPILGGTLGYVDCRVVNIFPGGDHDLFIGEIVAGEARSEGPPLLYF